MADAGVDVYLRVEEVQRAVLPPGRGQHLHQPARALRRDRPAVLRRLDLDQRVHDLRVNSVPLRGRFDQFPVLRRHGGRLTERLGERQRCEDLVGVFDFVRFDLGDRDRIDLNLATAPEVEDEALPLGPDHLDRDRPAGRKVDELHTGRQG